MALRLSTTQAGVTMGTGTRRLVVISLRTLAAGRWVAIMWVTCGPSMCAYTPECRARMLRRSYAETSPVTPSTQATTPANRAD